MPDKPIRTRSVTACLVTRGDQPEMMDAILESLIFERVVIWDNSKLPDWKCAGRYMAAMQAKTDLVYWQDDDVLVPRETQSKLLHYWQNVADNDPSIVANWGHGVDPDGYDDLPLVCGGAIANKRAAFSAIAAYGARYPLDQEFMYEADFAIGVLYPSFRHLHLPFDINMSVAQHESRLVNQPWQKDLKAKITARARAIRDGVA